jgi:hypothetical protein
MASNSDIADRAQNFALFGNCDSLVELLVAIEPTDGGRLEGTDGRERCRRDLRIVGEFPQRCESLLARV